MKLRVLNKVLEVSAEYCGIVKKWNSQMHKFNIEVKSATATETFKFFMGLGRNPKFEKDEDFADVLYAVFSDAFNYLDAGDIDDFQSAFGYTKASEMLEAYNGCRMVYTQVRNLGFEDNDLLHALDYLVEHYNV